MQPSAALSVKSIVYALSPALLKGVYARLEASPLGYRLARGAFWSLAGSIIARGLGLASGIIVARLLGKEPFGQLAVIQNTVGLFGTLAGFGLGLTATKHVAEYKNTDPARAGRIIGLSSLVAWGTGFIATAALFVLAPWLARRTLAAPELDGLLRIGALLLLLGGVNGAQTGALAGFEAFKSIAQVSVKTGILSFPLTLLGTLAMGLRGAVWAQVANLAVNCVLNFLALRREASRAGVSLGYSRCWSEWPVLWTFSLPSVLGGALAGPVTWAASAILVNQANGYSEMGIYNAVLRIKAVPELILGMVMAPLLPVLSEHFGRGDTAAYNKTLRYAFGLSLVMVVPISLLQIAAPILTVLPFGAEYREHSASVVQWLMVHAVFLGVFFPFSSIIPSMNRTWFGLWYSVGYSALLLVFALLLIPRFGGAGMAGALTLSYVIASLVCVLYIYRREKSFVGDVRLSPIIWTVAIACIVCAVATRMFSPGTAGIVGAGVVAVVVALCLRRTLSRCP